MMPILEGLSIPAGVISLSGIVSGVVDLIGRPALEHMAKWGAIGFVAGVGIVIGLAVVGAALSGGTAIVIIGACAVIGAGYGYATRPRDSNGYGGSTGPTPTQIASDTSDGVTTVSDIVDTPAESPADTPSLAPVEVTVRVLDDDRYKFLLPDRSVDCERDAGDPNWPANCLKYYLKTGSLRVLFDGVPTLIVPEIRGALLDRYPGSSFEEKRSK